MNKLKGISGNFKIFLITIWGHEWYKRNTLAERFSDTYVCRLNNAIVLGYNKYNRFPFFTEMILLLEKEIVTEEMVEWHFYVAYWRRDYYKESLWLGMRIKLGIVCPSSKQHKRFPSHFVAFSQKGRCIYNKSLTYRFQIRWSPVIRIKNSPVVTSALFFVGGQ